MNRRRSSSVTIRDVAQKAGVSAATVSRYINRSALVSTKVAERIQGVMEELHYVPHAAARQLATQKAHVIGLLMPSMNNDFSAPLVSGIESVVQQEGYNLLVATHRPGVRIDAHIPIGAHNSDGMIVFAGSLDDCEILKLHEAGFPLVLIYRMPPKDSNIPCVTIRNKRATQKLIDHLIETHNRSKIVFMRGPSSQEDSHWREIGYRNSLETHNIEYDPNLIISGEYDRKNSYHSMSKFLEDKHPEFDAVFTGNDDSAVGVIDALYEKKLRVPDDISVVGFDNVKLSAFLTPSLTTVNAPTESVGRTAAQHLFRLLANREVDTITLLSTEIVIRRSCGCSA